MDAFDQESTDETREKRRVRQLLNQLDEITDGQMVFKGTTELPPEVEVSFLEHMIRHETAPQTTWLAKLKSVGYKMPDPRQITEPELGLELWQVIQRLFELRVFLYNTNHLSDRVLYEKLFFELLAVDVPDFPVDEHSAYHIDMIGSGCEEDVNLWLTYYADENDRTEWQKQNPNEHLPTCMTPPFARDHLLPKREVLPNAFKMTIKNLISADWISPDSPIRLAHDLSSSDVGQLDIVVASLLLLEHLETEEDIHLLHQARITCEAAGLIRKRKGIFKITKSGRETRKPENIGALYRALFIAFFKINSLAFYDRMQDQLTCVQETLSVILWRLSLVARDWMDLETLTSQTLLPYVYDQVTNFEDAHTDLKKGEFLETRVWQHLRQFGLMEAAPANEDGNINHRYETYRISPLFDRFLSFHVNWH